MRVALVVCTLFATACGKAPAEHALTACRGDCPKGECNDYCASVDAGCSTPEECLAHAECEDLSRVACAKYPADEVNGWSSPPACATVPGSYCARARLADAGTTLVAVVCTPEGVAATDCGAVDVCVDEYPADCVEACGPRYCLSRRSLPAGALARRCAPR